MERIVEAIPKYFPILQKPFCCSCACVQMVLLRHGIRPPTQDEIAKLTDVGVSKEDAKCFMGKLRVGKPYGIKTITKSTEARYNSFFKTKKFPFKVKAFKLSEIKDHKKFIIDNLEKGNDMHLELCMKNITGKANVHDCILSKIRCDSKTFVTIVDPWWANKQYHEVEMKTLLQSMDKKWFGRELGFLIYYEK
jgi:hypothetical protein